MVKQLGDGIKVHKLKHGLALIAGDYPEIGDVNKQIDTPLLKKIAQVIKPISYFGDDGLDVYFEDSEDMRTEWEQRFF